MLICGDDKKAEKHIALWIFWHQSQWMHKSTPHLLLWRQRACDCSRPVHFALSRDRESLVCTSFPSFISHVSVFRLNRGYYYVLGINRREHRSPLCTFCQNIKQCIIIVSCCTARRPWNFIHALFNSCRAHLPVAILHRGCRFHVFLLNYCNQIVLSFRHP